jgi:hypothetical protein
MQEIRQWVSTGQFYATDLACFEGMSAWIPLPDLVAIAEGEPSLSIPAPRIPSLLLPREFGWKLILFAYGAAFIDRAGCQRIFVPADIAPSLIEAKRLGAEHRVTVKRGGSKDSFMVDDNEIVKLWLSAQRGIGELLQWLGSTDWTVRQRALRAIVYKREWHAREQLWERVGKEDVPFLRYLTAVALDALGQGRRAWGVVREAESILAQPVLAAGFFSCGTELGLGGHLASAGLSFAGGVLGAAAGPVGLMAGAKAGEFLVSERSSNQEVKAAGLQRFLALAITERDVHAISYSVDGKRASLGSVLATWPRSLINAEVTNYSERGVTLEMRLSAPGHDKRLVFAGLDDAQSPGSFDKVIRLLCHKTPSSPTNPFSYQNTCSPGARYRDSGSVVIPAEMLMPLPAPCVKAATEALKPASKI